MESPAGRFGLRSFPDKPAHQQINYTGKTRLRNGQIRC